MLSSIMNVAKKFLVDYLLSQTVKTHLRPTAVNMGHGMDK